MFLIKKTKQKLKVRLEMDNKNLFRPMKSGHQEQLSIY